MNYLFNRVSLLRTNQNMQQDSRHSSSRDVHSESFRSYLCKTYTVFHCLYQLYYRPLLSHKCNTIKFYIFLKRGDSGWMLLSGDLPKIVPFINDIWNTFRSPSYLRCPLWTISTWRLLLNNFSRVTNASFHLTCKERLTLPFSWSVVALLTVYTNYAWFIACIRPNFTFLTRNSLVKYLFFVQLYQNLGELNSMNGISFQNRPNRPVFFQWRYPHQCDVLWWKLKTGQNCPIVENDTHNTKCK